MRSVLRITTINFETLDFDITKEYTVLEIWPRGKFLGDAELKKTMYNLFVKLKPTGGDTTTHKNYFCQKIEIINS